MVHSDIAYMVLYQSGVCDAARVVRYVGEYRGDGAEGGVCDGLLAASLF